jgi:hypothetical protein
MDRKEFLKTCVCGCACAVAGLAPNAIGPSATGSASAFADDAPKPEDWRFTFVKRRYAKLLEILAGKMDEKAMDDVLRQLGRNCASMVQVVSRHKGDIDGYIADFKKQYHEDITYDREKGVVTVVSEERTDCFCPLVGLKQKTPKIACNCSLGWQQYVYETMLGKQVRAELKESVLRGGKRCIFEIHVGDDLPTKT